MNLSKRQVEIIVLLTKEQTCLSSDKIANVLDVSSRTIRREIKTLNMYLAEQNLQIKSLKGKGFYIPKENYQRVKDFLVEEGTYRDEIVPDIQTKRVEWIERELAKIALKDGCITYDDLAADLYISLSTLKRDMDVVKDDLASFNLALVKKDNKGMKVVGEENHLRTFISYQLTRENQLINFNKVYVFDDDVRASLKGLLLEALKKYELKVTDMGFQNLLLHLEILIARIEKRPLNQVISKIKEVDESSKEYKCAHYLCVLIEKEFDLIMPEQEKMNIYIHLISQKKVISQFSEEIMSISEDKETLYAETLKEIKEVYQLDFENDLILKQGILTHLESVLKRISLDMPIRNDMLEAIIENYPFEIQLANFLASNIKKTLEIVLDMNEVGYLALHFCGAMERHKYGSKGSKKSVLIVCTTGMGTSVLLQTKLKSRLGDLIQVKGTCAYYELPERDLSGIDLIISTVHLSEEWRVPYIYISPVVSDEEINIVKHAVQTQTKHLTISELISPDLFLVLEGYWTKENLLSFIEKKLQENRYADKDCAKSITNREKLGTTEIGNGVAIPHSMTGIVYKPCMMVIVLEKPIDWEVGKVSLVISLVCDKSDDSDYRKLFMDLYEKIDTEYKVNRILNERSFEQFKNNII